MQTRRPSQRREPTTSRAAPDDPRPVVDVRGARISATPSRTTRAPDAPPPTHLPATRALVVSSEPAAIGARRGAEPRDGAPLTDVTLTEAASGSRAALRSAVAPETRPGLVARVTVPRVIPVPQELEGLADVFADAGHTLYVVGGAVRDALLGRAPKDLDLATDAPPDEARRILERAGRTVVEKSAALGVSAVVLGGVSYELASFRTDATESDGRRPRSVTHGTIEDDALRRDLTINALYYDVRAKTVVDLVGGLEDVEHRRARVIGDPDVRFREDGLRVLRFLRLHAKLDGGPTLDADVARALPAHAAMPGVSAERLR
ncbi:CCA tRNA nucleotidyltransferase, partial [Myxococcota bacterium]|nr:CCA tRNA nucleotidyltransferase [Myxococcota bacterium]